MTPDQFRAATTNLGLCAEARTWVSGYNADDVTAAWADVAQENWYRDFVVKIHSTKKITDTKFRDILVACLTAWKGVIEAQDSRPVTNARAMGSKVPQIVIELIAQFSNASEDELKNLSRYMDSLMQSIPVSILKWAIDRFGRTGADEVKVALDAATKQAIRTSLTADEVKAALA